MAEKRRRIWIDRFQTYLFLRVAAYCIFYQAALWFFLAVWRQFCAARETLVGPTDLANNWMAAVVILLAVAPIITYDTLRFAHRLVGPLYRFRRTIRAIAQGEPVALVQLRQGDFLQDMKEEFNTMLRVLEQRGLVILTPKGEAATKEPQLTARD